MRTLDIFPIICMQVMQFALATNRTNSIRLPNAATMPTTRIPMDFAMVRTRETAIPAIKKDAAQTLQSVENDIGIYYSIEDGELLKVVSDNMTHYNASDDAEAIRLSNGVGGGNQQRRRLAFRSNGCSCQALTCGCCTGIHIQQFNFNQEGCMNFTYDPDEFSMIMNVFMNDDPIFTNAISAKNPPPLCIPFQTPILITVHFCARLFDIHTPGQNLQMCLDLETRIQFNPIFVLHFNCVRMGLNGFALVKPGDPLPPSPGTSPPSWASTTQPTVTDVDDYDEVTEMKKSQASTTASAVARKI